MSRRSGSGVSVKKESVVSVRQQSALLQSVQPLSSASPTLLPRPVLDLLEVARPLALLVHPTLVRPRQVRLLAVSAPGLS